MRGERVKVDVSLFSLAKKSVAKYYQQLKYQDTVPNSPSNSDLFIVEFPKSGITWFSTIIANTCLLEEGVNKEATHFNLEQLIGDVHQNMFISETNLFPYHRIIKSHDAFNPYYRHVIYLVRNPFSVMSSYHHFALSNNFFQGDFETFIKDERLGVMQWVNHVNSWMKPNRPLKMHCLKYEDLIDEPQLTIQNLYKNLGWSIASERIETSIDKSNFQNMKKLNDHYKTYCPFRKYDFVRKGKKDTEMPKECEDYIYDKTEEILKVLYPELVRK